MQTQDLRISRINPLPTPLELRRKLPASKRSVLTVINSRKIIEQILLGRDKRFLSIVGPCSIHDKKAAIEYARKLANLQKKLKRIFIVMRAYFEKPRTGFAWKGLVNDPFMDGTCELAVGLERSREICSAISNMGLPIGTEALDPVNIQYIADFLSWASIGARTVESPTHREMASGLSMPIGFKNSTSGSVQSAVDAIKFATYPQTFSGVNNRGRSSLIRTTGNPTGHLVLRGGKEKTNFDAISIANACAKLSEAGLPPVVIVDCSHGNSGKKPQKQRGVLTSVVNQRASGNNAIVGVMIESNLFGGRQAIPKDLSMLKYGISVTDACSSWEDTERMLLETHERLSVAR